MDATLPAARRIRRVLNDRSGNVLPLAAVGVFVMAALAGGAVDMGRAYRVQNRLQNACDAGVLSGRRAVTNNGFDGPAQTQAKNYFDINFDEAQQGTNTTVFLTSSDASGKAIGGKASTKMPMILMQLFGASSMNISVNCAATMGVGNSDVTMVLDTTGSMGGSISGGGTRIAALRTAMKNFHATISTATQGTNARVRYAIVPFSTAVNVGRILHDRDPDYLVDEWAVSTAIPYNSLTKTNRYKKASIDLNAETITFTASPNSNWAAYTALAYPDATSCTKALPSPTAWLPSGTPTITTSNTNNGNGRSYPTTKTAQTEKATFYTCSPSGSAYYRYSYVKTRTHNTWVYVTLSDDPLQSSNTTTPFNHADYRIAMVDTSTFKNFTPVTTTTGYDGSSKANGTTITATWNGCIEERRTVNSNAISFSAVTGLSPSGLIDLDIDLEPTSDPATKWAPMWQQVGFYRNSLGVSNSGYTLNGNAPCPSAASLLAPMTTTEMNNAANALIATGNTYLDVGMLWGARFSSPDGMFGDIVNDPPANGGNVNRHVVFMTDGDMNTNNGLISTYGVEGLDHRVTTDGRNGTSDANHSLRYRAICDAIKAKGIRIWAIQFDDTVSTLQSDLAYCASPNSAFMAKSAAQLNAAFQEIAKQVGELRVMS